ncbi:MAG: diadenylate cyclase CdaA [Spirochaetes bacterium]|nr:diadenylate cyclase CdaA [Spirochaetota bacterium]
MNPELIASIYYDYIRPVLDVAVLAFLVYKTYQILVKTQAIQLVKGALFMAIIYAGAVFLSLSTLAWVLNILAPGLVIALAIVFQPELRKIFMRIGQGGFFRQGRKKRYTQIEAVLNAAELLAGKRRGALVVFARSVGLKNIIDTGTRLDCEISSSIIQTIFEFDTILHDGAVIVQDGRIVAAGCLLPLSEQQDIRRSFGTRHRAALGITEEADAVVLVVSEETGALSLACDAKLFYNLPSSLVQRRLAELLNLAETGEAVEESPGEA